MHSISDMFRIKTFHFFPRNKMLPRNFMALGISPCIINVNGAIAGFQKKFLLVIKALGHWIKTGTRDYNIPTTNLRNIYSAAPLIKEKLPRQPWLGVANHMFLFLGPTHSAPSSCPPPPLVVPQGQDDKSLCRQDSPPHLKRMW